MLRLSRAAAAVIVQVRVGIRRRAVARALTVGGADVAGADRPVDRHARRRGAALAGMLRGAAGRRDAAASSSPAAAAFVARLVEGADGAEPAPRQSGGDGDAGAPLPLDMAALADAVTFLCHPALRGRYAGAAGDLFTRVAERNGAGPPLRTKKGRKHSRECVAAVLESALAAERAQPSNGLAVLRRCVPAVEAALDAGVPLTLSSIANVVALCMRVSMHHPSDRDGRRRHVAAVEDASRRALGATSAFQGATSAPVPAEIASADRVYCPLLRDWYAWQVEGCVHVGGKPLPKRVVAGLLKDGNLDAAYFRDAVLAIGPKRAVSRLETSKLVALVCGLGAGGEGYCDRRTAGTKLAHAMEAYGLLLELGSQPRPEDAMRVLFAAFDAGMQSPPGTAAFTEASKAARYIVNDVAVKYREDKRVGAGYKALVASWFSAPSRGSDLRSAQSSAAGPRAKTKEKSGADTSRRTDNNAARGTTPSYNDLVRHGASGDVQRLMDAFSDMMATARGMERARRSTWVNGAAARTLSQLLRIASAEGNGVSADQARIMEQAGTVVEEMERSNTEWNDGVFSILTKLYTQHCSDDGAVMQLLEKGRQLGLSIRLSAAVDVQLWAVRAAEGSLLPSTASSASTASTPAGSPWVATVDNVLAIFDGFLKPALANALKKSPSAIHSHSALLTRILDVCAQRCQRGPSEGGGPVWKGGLAVLEALVTTEGTGISNECAASIERWFKASSDADKLTAGAGRLPAPESGPVVRRASVRGFGSPAGDAQCSACGTVLRAHSLSNAQHAALLDDVNQVFPSALLDPAIAESQAAGSRVDVVLDGANVGFSLPGQPARFRFEAITQFLRHLNASGARAHFNAKHSAAGKDGAASLLRALVVLPNHYAPPDEMQKQWVRWGHSVLIAPGRDAGYDDHAWLCACLRLLEPGRHAVYCVTNDNMADLTDILVSPGNQAAFREWRRAHQITYSWAAAAPDTSAEARKHTRPPPRQRLDLRWPWGPDGVLGAHSYACDETRSAVADVFSMAPAGVDLGMGGDGTSSTTNFHFPVDSGGSSGDDGNTAAGGNGWLCVRAWQGEQ